MLRRVTARQTANLAKASALLATTAPQRRSAADDALAQAISPDQSRGGAFDDDAFGQQLDYGDFGNTADNNTTVLGEEQDDTGLIVAVEALIDDLSDCRTDVLKHFARSRGAKGNSKANIIMEMIDLAAREISNPREFLATKRVLGDTVSQALPTQAVRSNWTGEKLEATMLEEACEKVVQHHKTLHVMAKLRNNANRAGRHAQSLLRPLLDEYDAISAAAVGGMHKQFRDEANELLRQFDAPQIVTAFAAILRTRVMEAQMASLVGCSDVVGKMVSLGLLKPTVESGNIDSLERLMTLLDQVTSEIEVREKVFDQEGGATSSSRWGEETPETLREVVASLRRRHADWELEDTPPWVGDMAKQFASWEALVRNDISALRQAPASVFDAILVNVVAVRSMQQLHSEDVKGDRGVPQAYRGLLHAELTAFAPDRIDDIVLKLNHYAQIDKAESARITGQLFEAIYTQMQATLPDELARPAPERVAIILHEYNQTAHRSERVASLSKVLVEVAESLRFHLRFCRVYSHLSKRDRDEVKENDKINLLKMLPYFEQEHDFVPMSIKSVAFLCTILYYFSTRSSGHSLAVVAPLTSCTRNEELSIVTYTERNQTRVADLDVKLPPRLQHDSWLDAEKSGSLYKLVNSRPVKGSTSDIMLASQAPMIRALDAISAVPWQVNKYMLNVQEAILQQGYAFGKLRPAFYPLNYARMKTGVFNDNVEAREEDKMLCNQTLRQKYKTQREDDWHELKDVNSSRVHYLQSLRQARALCNVSHIYFPNNVDFRGRMYPLSGRFNHTASDPTRALLEHADPKPLGEEGLFWLKVHLANKMGHTKLPFKQRAVFVEEHISDVVQSAEAPLSGDRWWQEADEPLQALMACKELADALKYSEGPEKYPSRLPVAVDGSYNGLQHYSAIGRDKFGAELVNLVPSPAPADAYTGILKVLIKKIQTDADNDHPVAHRCIGSGKGLDKNHLKRKTIKRPIMTQVYGVTGYGMSIQVEEELMKQNLAHGLWSKAEMKEMAMYIRDLINSSLGEIFQQTQECRAWLSTVANLIWSCQPRDLHVPFMWTTPLGLIVRQPYRAAKEQNFFSPRGYARINGSTVEPASPKQLSALAPNIIHSLDATHLAMTAMEMQNQGLRMMAVHDSYWTHACDLPSLSRILREQFVGLYTEFDPLWELKNQWEEMYFHDLRRHSIRLPDPPQRGDLDLTKVLESEYFFS